MWDTQDSNPEATGLQPAPKTRFSIPCRGLDGVGSAVFGCVPRRGGVLAHLSVELSPVAPECHHRVTGTGVVPPAHRAWTMVCLVAAGPGMRNPTRRAENGRV